MAVPTLHPRQDKVRPDCLITANDCGEGFICVPCGLGEGCSNRGLAGFCRPKVKSLDTQSASQNLTKCDAIRGKKFEDCWSRSRPYGFDICIKEGQDAWNKCTAVPKLP